MTTTDKYASMTDKNSLVVDKGTLVADKYTSIRLETSPSGVTFLVIDCPGRTNVLDSATMTEMRETLQKIVADPQVRTLVIMSGKNDHFASGAGLHEILLLTNSEDAYRLVKCGQEVFTMLAALGNLGKPTVVGIHGACLGGGLELALCGSRRIATVDDATQLGLPEVKIG